MVARFLFVLFSLVCLSAGGGCGTFGNTFIPCGAGAGTRPHIYGGIENDVEWLKSAWIPSETEEEKTAATRPVSRSTAALVVTLLIAVDLPLSLAADTITLPWVVVGNGIQGWESLKMPKTDSHPNPDSTVQPNE
jgi:hypothetical protein